MWVFVERVGDLYVGVAHDDEGRQLLEITEPISDSEMHAQMEEVSDGDCYEVDCALYDADERPNDGRASERKSFHLLRIRAQAGLTSQADGAWVIDQLRDRESIHDTRFLLWTLGYMGPQYESVVAPFLNHPNTNMEAEYAMDALFQMGLFEKYADLFVEWMRGSAPPAQNQVGSMVYGTAVHAFRKSQSPKILRALIDASNDVSEMWTTREHARSCLAMAIDLENAPLGERLPADHPYYASVVEKAEVLLAELTAEEGGQTLSTI
jgi:hypothetical protein